MPWWVLRYISLHQQILEDSSPQLHSLAQSSMDKGVCTHLVNVCTRACVCVCLVGQCVFLSASVMESQAHLSEHLHLAIQLHLECAYLSLMYYDYKSAQEHLQKAQELSGLDISMTGTCT